MFFSEIFGCVGKIIWFHEITRNFVKFGNFSVANLQHFTEISRKKTPPKFRKIYLLFSKTKFRVKPGDCL